MVKNNKQNKLSPNKVAIIASIMALIGLYLFSYNYVAEKRQMAYDYMSARIFKNKEVATVNVEYDESEEPEDNGPVTNEFIGFLEIPSISFKKGFLHMDAEDNDVEKNIYVVPSSTFPDRKKSNLIIAAHSGTGWRAFFNDLYRLEKGDIANVYFKGMKYTYKLVNIYTQPKVGTVNIYRNPKKSTLTLITCTNHDNTTQTIYILELISSTQE